VQSSLIGYGKTTKAIAKALGGGEIFFDDNIKESFQDRYKNRVYPSSMFNPESSEVEILTPSIPPLHTILRVAKNPISEYDIFLAEPTLSGIDRDKSLSNLYRPKPTTVWISGTNGKTTTTQMLTHILSNRGAISGGNIGVPLAELNPDAPLWILETSSYTLHHTRFASPDIYLLLPITPDHLSWHGSRENYIRDKLKPLLSMREGELALIPKGLNPPKSRAWVVEYEDDGNGFIESFFDLDSSLLKYRSGFLQDALLALAVERTLFDTASYELLNRFSLDNHRQEEIRDRFGRIWVNDSKATNIDATHKALEAYRNRKKIYLIVGGDDKGVDMNPLIGSISDMSVDVELYTIGSNSKKLDSLSKDYGLNSHRFFYLEEAVRAIERRLKVDEVVLLSPAASSLDQFSSYAERGDKFKRLIKGF
jgi:UDP-N-acetylmuramoylalanine--D-glutamate ligase